MRRHSTDPVALLAGALFITVGAAYLAGALSDTKIEARWVLPTVLITLGFAGLLASLVNLARQRRTTGVAAQTVGSGSAAAGPGADATATTPLETGRPETMPMEPAPPATTEPAAVETETVEPEPESPAAEPPRTIPLDTPPVDADNEPGDAPRDRS